MKIEFILSKPKIPIPKNYQHLLAGVFYKSLKKISDKNNNIYNNYHEELNIHSISQLYGTKKIFNGDFIANPNVDFLKWCISSPNNEMLLKVCSEIWKKRKFILDINLIEFNIINSIQSNIQHKFLAQSPIILKETIKGEKHYYVVEDDEKEKKKTISGRKQNYYIHRDDKKCSEIMKNNVLHKARILNIKISENFKIYFDNSYKNKKIRNVFVKKDINNNIIKAIATTCPIIVEGDNKIINFISELGVGHSTGMGFGYI